MQRLLCLLILSACCSTLGCSSLGFSTYPVAHFITKQTKQVLKASPSRPMVARELAKEVLPAHYLQPGDELLIEAVCGESEVRLPADQQVAADGSLDLGQFGRVIVTSMTVEQAERMIHETLNAVEKVDVVVNVRLIQPIHHYYVVGEVNSPGAYPLTGYETVLDGLMAAGGLTSRASACDTLLARPTDPCSCRVTLPVCYRAITQLGDTTTNYQLKPGDRIFVGRQTFMEEFLPCFSTKTCERCCYQQTACCDPNLSQRVTADFATPAIHNIPGLQMLTSDEEGLDSSSATPTEGVANQSEDNFRPWREIDGSLSRESMNSQRPAGQPVPETQIHETDTQDGQLDFAPIVQPPRDRSPTES